MVYFQVFDLRTVSETKWNAQFKSMTVDICNTHRSSVLRVLLFRFSVLCGRRPLFLLVLFLNFIKSKEKKCPSGWGTWFEKTTKQHLMISLVGSVAENSSGLRELRCRHHRCIVDVLVTISGTPALSQNMMWT